MTRAAIAAAPSPRASTCRWRRCTRPRPSCHGSRSSRRENVIGTSTISAMQSGVFWGYVGLIEGLVGRIRRNWQADDGHRHRRSGLAVPRLPGRSNISTGPDHPGLLEIYAINRELIAPERDRRVKPSRTRFLPLGGSNEIGMNSTSTARPTSRWIVVDLGIGFADDDARRRYRAARPALHRGAARPIDGHGADPRPRGPYRCGGLSVAAAGRRSAPRRSPPSCCAQSCARPTSADDVPIRIVAPGGEFRSAASTAGSFTLTHSIPDANALAIETPLGAAAAHRRLEARPGAAGGRADR